MIGRWKIKIEAWGLDGSNLGTHINMLRKGVKSFDDAKIEARKLWNETFKGYQKQMVIFDHEGNEKFYYNNWGGKKKDEKSTDNI